MTSRTCRSPARRDVDRARPRRASCRWSGSSRPISRTARWTPTPAPAWRMEGIALAKTLAHWIATGIPLAISSRPSSGSCCRARLRLRSFVVLGLAHRARPAFFFFGSIGAALAAGMRRGGLFDRAGHPAALCADHDFRRPPPFTPRRAAGTGPSRSCSRRLSPPCSASQPRHLRRAMALRTAID